MAIKKVSSTIAMQIARVEKLRFNEAVASGFYPCAPQTTAGVPRMFDVNDMITLIVYRHLNDEGVIPRAAGPMACGLRELLMQHPQADRVVWVKASVNTEQWLLGSEFDPAWTHLPVFGNYRPDIISFREWRLNYMRAYIEHGIEEAQSNLFHPADRED